MLKLRKAIESKGLTIKSCAKILGISEKTMQNKVSGSTDFLYREVKELSTIFPEYNMDYLLTNDSNTTNQLVNSYST